MTKNLYRYDFVGDVNLEEVEAVLLLSVMATECLHGLQQTRLDASYLFDQKRNASIIDAGTPVGRDLNRLFTGFIVLEFGSDSFTVDRLGDHDRQFEEVAA